MTVPIEQISRGSLDITIPARFAPLKPFTIANLEGQTSRTRTFKQDDDTETTVLDYGFEDGDVLKLYDDSGGDVSSPNDPVEPPRKRERLSTHEANVRTNSQTLNAATSTKRELREQPQAVEGRSSLLLPILPPALPTDSSGRLRRARSMSMPANRMIANQV